MAEHRSFDILAGNLDLIHGRMGDLRQILSGQYREAVLLYAEKRENDAFSSPSEEAAVLFRRICPTIPLCSTEFALFCMEFGELFRDELSIASLFPSDEQEAAEEIGKTVYMQNVYGDRAYRHFSSEIPGLRGAYSVGYASACEEVYYGRSNYVILPIYHSKDGSLITFRRMLTKYDLKITSACPVETDDGDVVLYVLAQKGLSDTPGDYMDMSFVPPDGSTAAQFLSLCELFGLQLRIMNSVPLEYASDTMGKHEISATFLCSGANLISFALFLTASHTRYDIEGIYNIIN